MKARTNVPEGEALGMCVEDAARLIGVSRAYAWKLVYAGELPSVRLGRRVLVRRATLDAFLASHEGRA